ncbi:MAG: hypothetical protein R8P61_11390 [Bacteroidia bacterium]|nr:hypothetical protein [Bacteroidia bacterium]
MKLDRIFLFIAALAGLGSLFLPFFNNDYLLDSQMQVSAYNYGQVAANATGTYEYAESNGFWNATWNLTKSINQPQDYATVAGAFFTLALPAIFLLFFLGYMLKALRGKQYSNGIFLTLLSLGIAWASFYFMSAESAQALFGPDVETPLNFFGMAGIGFWAAFGSMLAAAFSLFFAKNLE